MARLAPWPTDVLRLTLYISALSGDCTVTQSIWNPGSSTATVGDLQSFISAWFAFSLGDLTGVMPSNSSVVACRLSTSGPAYLNYSEGLAPNAGAFGSCTSLNAALCLTWLTNDAKINAHSHTLLPLAEEYIGDDRQTLTSFAYDAGGSAAAAYVDHVGALVSVDGATCELVVVHRIHEGAPLIPSQYSPVVGGLCSPRIGTLSRRIRKSRRFPSF